jgi:BrnA antitoxin of type II toxin-antitoxin system
MRRERSAIRHGELRHGDRLVRRGRPPLSGKPKTAITLRLDEDVVEAYRETGDGWQTRINADLRRARKLTLRTSTATRSGLARLQKLRSKAPLLLGPIPRCDCRRLLRGLEFSREPPDSVGLDRIRRHRTRLGMIAFGALKQPEFETFRPRRYVFQFHSPLTARTSWALKYGDELSG